MPRSRERELRRRPPDDLEALAAAAPLMPGAEYLTADVLRALWARARRGLRRRAAPSREPGPGLPQAAEPGLERRRARALQPRREPQGRAGAVRLPRDLHARGSRRTARPSTCRSARRCASTPARPTRSGSSRCCCRSSARPSAAPGSSRWSTRARSSTRCAGRRRRRSGSSATSRELGARRRRRAHAGDLAGTAARRGRR